MLPNPAGDPCPAQIRHNPPSTLRLSTQHPKVGLTELTMGGIVGQ
jgi:hypothetical protein